MLKALARLILRLGGWTMTGRIPDIDKGVFIAAPHTSNWDGFWFLVYKVAQQVEVSFLAKESLFWWPLGTILGGMGAIPINRGDAADIVAGLVREFARRDHLFLALAPEGTRKWKPHWKTGFYRIAEAAGVPVTLAYIDYEKKEIGIGPTLPQGEPIENVLQSLREFYAGVKGRHPALQGPIEFPTT
jgi:1-acyl-sn-glycerol-3-phosphate acyltransferase